MSGLTFARPSFEELRGRLEIATPESTPHHGVGRRRDRLAAILHLSTIAMVGALTICVFFGLAFYFLVYPTDGVITISGARDLRGKVSLPTVFPAPVIADSVSAPQPTQPGRSGQSAQLAQLAAIAPAFFSGPELRRERAGQNPEPKRFRTATIESVSGPVTEVTDAMTWVVGGQIIHLWGIRPGPRTLSPYLTGVAARVNAEGPINCRRQTHSTRYRCSTATGEDVAETELLSGIGRAADGATAYLSAEAQARRKDTGLRPRP